MFGIRKLAYSFCWLFLFFGMTSFLNAQDLKDYSLGNLKYFAAESEARGDYLTAAEIYEELSQRKPKNQKYQYSLARNLHASAQFSKAKGLYAQLTESNKKDFPLAPFYLGRILVMEGNCEDAVEILDQFRKDYRGEKEDQKYRRMAKFTIESCTEGSFPKEKKLIVQPLSKEINGANMEGSPLFESPDRIIYNSLKADPNRVYEGEDALPTPQYFIAKKEEDGWKIESTWDQLKPADGYYPTSGAFNLDRSRFYFSACKDLYSPQKQCDLFRVEIKNGQWSEIEKMGDAINGNSQERHPAVGIDEKGRETLYFSSDREEGKGGFDIWYSTYYAKKDEYRDPKNAGSKINSVGDDITPFVDPESGVMYWSSDAHPGLGGFDIFSSTGSKSKWMEPKNKGSEINSPMDEVYYTLDPSGQSGMFVSNRTYGQKKQPCCDDLFYFTDPDLVRLSYNGTVKDEEGNRVEEAVILVYEVDDSTGESYLRKRMLTNADGIYEFRIEPNKSYKLKAEKEGYFTQDKDISTMGKISSKKYQMNLNLNKLTDKAFILENIYYDFNEADLSEKATTIIDTTIYDILVENPTIVVEIGSHTDSKGRSEYNLSLSQRRAESVVKYLIKRGILKDRLKAKGYGETVPVSPNKLEDGSDNPEGRAKNRRTEFRVIGKIKIVETDD